VEADTARVENDLTTRVDTESMALVRMAKQWEYWANSYQEIWIADTEEYVNQHHGYEAIAWVDPTMHARWLAPAEGNAWLQDRDLSRDDKLKQALSTARRELEVSVGKATQLPDGAYGLPVCVPISKDDEFAGFIVGIFDLPAMFDRVVERRLPAAYHVTAFVGSEPIYIRNAESEPLGPELEYKSTFAMRDESWRIHVTPDSQSLAAAHTLLPSATLTAGMLMALLLSLSVHLAQKADFVLGSSGR
jgi:sensor domain CHASE-containing protein